MLNAYNRIAPFYDSLAHLVYGDSLLSIQKKLIYSLPTEGSLLILGGGTGQLLKSIHQQTPNIEITFLEASSTMLTLAKYNSPVGQDITFIHSDNLIVDKQVDLILVAFFWDTFRSSEIAHQVEKLDNHYKSPLWLVADFQQIEKYKWPILNSIKLKLSILFFKIVANHKPNKMPPVFDIYTRLGFKTLASNNLRSTFIRSEVFKR